MRPRYGRITALMGSVSVTVVALLGAGGALPTGGFPAQAGTTPTGTAGNASAALALSAYSHPATRQLEVEPGASSRPDRPVPKRTDVELPARSGKGKRVVFDMSDQRVWLVGRGGEVRRTYLVSGSLTDNLEPGRYEVYSTSRHAIGIDDSGTMEYMVRFAHGDRAAIGFHDIPVDDGEPVQTRAQLGTPRSHGCIRQARPDAKALWYFAIVGTKVVVTA